MSIKHETPNMAERCRICLIDQGCMTNLQDECLEAKLKDLISCTSIDIKYEENLPGVVCHVCLYKLNMWSEFKEQFIQSNKSLEQLDMLEESDNTIEDSFKDSSCTTKDAERKRRNCQDNSIEKKKTRIDTSSLEIACDPDQIIIDTICISDNDSSPKKKNAQNGEERAEGQMYSGPMRARLLPARRGRNIERRKASTKRWVERKKALLAAIGGHVSDTDSIASDEMQLSPVQKARAKDKEIERQRKIAKVLKNLETSLSEKYVLHDKNVDSDARRTRSTLQHNNKSLLNQNNKKDTVERNRSSIGSSIENSPSLLTNDFTLNDEKKFETQDNDQAFEPSSLKSEVVIGDATFCITSTLILVDGKNEQAEHNNSTKDSKSFSPDENNRERNTDIFDAVQLRRVNPVINKSQNNNKSKNKSKFIERCLNIEVEGNELSVLKRVQCELANFVQKEIKHKLFSTNDDDAKTNKTDNTQTDSPTFFREKLDQKLKDIIQKAIKKNIMSSEGNTSDAYSQSSKVSSVLAKLPRYQPKVMVKRLDIAKESKHYNINNVRTSLSSSKRKLASPFITRNKRASIIPERYGEYVSLDIDSDSEVSKDDTIEDPNEWCPTPKTTNSKTSKNTSRQIIIGKSVEKKQNEQKTDSEKIVKIANTPENHICGVCGSTFHSRMEVEAHVRSHKLAPGASVVQVVLQNNEIGLVSQQAKPPQIKQKLMRCKRCHEIVEARFVKAHICKNTFKCHVCNSMFSAKNLLLKHLENNHDTKFKLNVIENKKNNTDTLQKIVVASASQQKAQDQAQGTEITTKTQTLKEKNDIQSDKITSTGVKLESAENILTKPKETYTCFVCDKIFTDEEVLKDHLQKHCDDLSEGEQTNSKEQYQCAICGSTLESDQALEEHVGNHLFDDEDDNPNLISIDQGNENNSKSKTNDLYQCGQCSETFDSEILLEMHMHAHEEEVAIAEWEQQGMKIYQYQCMLCDELFDSEKDLAEHLDIHNANGHVCQLCEKPFRTLKDLQEHVATH